MPPRPASAPITRLRSATTFAPSESDSAPATTAAAISPWLCPTTASGATPKDRHSAARDTIIAKNGRLDDVDAVERGCSGDAAQYVGQRPLHELGEGRLAVGDRGGEDGRLGEQVAGHAVPLRALSREEEHGSASALPGVADDHAGRGGRVGGEGAEPGEHLRAVPRHHDPPGARTPSA